MIFLRVAAALAAWCFLLSSPAGGADKFTYSGVPGKWKRQSKDAKGQGSQAESPAAEAEKGPQKKERTVTVTVPEEMVRPGKPPKKP